MLPCSSLAIRSASSINSVPKPYQTIKIYSVSKVPKSQTKREKPDLMLELSRITAMHRYCCAIYMKLSYNATTPL